MGCTMYNVTGWDEPKKIDEDKTLKGIFKSITTYWNDEGEVDGE